MIPQEIAKAWLKAFNDHDLEALLSLYAEDAKHFSPKLKQRLPETNGLIRGKEAMMSWWQDAFQRLPSLQYIEISITADTQKVFMEYIRKVEGGEDMAVAEILVIRNGKIENSRVYHG